MRVAEKLFVPVAPTLGIPGGRAGSSMVPPETSGEYIPMSVDVTGLSVVAALNEIAKRAPGHAWLVTTELSTPIEFGFIHEFGSGTHQRMFSR
jgi:hypothetical protein